ncbi:eIF2A-related protein [Actinosynnema mirum]|uniref:WD-40 repeat protein n=1 Tax=Actinosynnema mirum (strain ATCC 29888 / DSM 43827 / JCM 3225 / NBRC 14064 / NCIMB 13271 / NRRL B-12336 / IMRU 3971 / 101) TaxID=446462 RepID=C6WKI1_ACTMD|nr:pentapeptide repeat-containing protein [Actinosynnema mirum]ACU40232.1 WD-40 repeat protein [Actinosynnema mirum DSM 43827]
MLDADDNPVGGAVLLAGGKVMTCAHVVNHALRRHEREAGKPDAPVRLQFGPRTVTARVAHWMPPPAREGDPGDDIAGLEVTPPPDIPPARLITTLPRPNTVVRIFGYPGKPLRPDGAWVDALVKGRNSRGHLQLESTSALRVQPGFSGSPVWDDVTGRVVGIIATAGTSTPDSYAISAEQLRVGWSALGSSRTAKRPDTVTALHLPGPRAGGRGWAFTASDLLRDLPADTPPDLLVVAGDLTEQGGKAEFAQAFRLLADLAEDLDLPRDRVLVVPGAHDVNRKACKAYFDTAEADDEAPVPPFWPKWKQFSAAFDRFYDGHSPTFTADEPWTLFEIPDLSTVVAGFNSTTADTHERATTSLGRDQVARFRTWLDGFREPDRLRLGVVHGESSGSAWPDELHHLFSSPADNDGYQLVSFDASRTTRQARRFADGRWTGDTRISPTGTAWRVTERRRAEPAQESPPPPPGNAFFDRVVEATRFAHPDASTVPHPEKSYLRVGLPIPGGGVDYRPVGVVDGDLTERAVDAFVVDVHRHFTAEDPGTRSEIVYSGRLASADLVGRATRRGVSPRSWVEYRGLLDLGPLEERLRNALARDKVYPEALYTAQRYRVVGRHSSGEVEPDLLARVLDWLGLRARQFVVVLGDFGRGKSFLLRQLARALPEHLGGVTPLLVELRSLQKAPTLNQLLANALVGQGVAVVDVDKLRYMIASGRVALLFDGFDELELRVGYDNAADYLRTLLEVVGGEAKVVLTSRTQHFRSAAQVLTALGDEVVATGASRVVELEDFTREQIVEFLTKRYGGDHERARARLRLLDEVQDLLGLSRNPRMLSFIAELEEDRLREVQQRKGTISAADLYQELVDSWLLHEQARQQHRHGLPVLGKDERLRVCTDLATRLWSTGANAIQEDELGVVAVAALTEVADLGYTQDQVAHAIGSGTLLVTGESGFGFVHRSVMEWLVANEAARRLRAGEGVGEVAGRAMSRLMVDFLCDLAGHARARRWALAVSVDGLASAEEKQNALLVVDRLGGSGLGDLSELDLRKADLSRLDLRGTRLVGSDLRGQRVDGAVLRGVDLTGADLRGARVTGGDLSEAVLTGSRWEGAALLGVAGTERRPELRVAAVSGRDRAEVMLARSGPVLAVAYSPDGERIALAHGRQVELLNAAGHSSLRFVGEHGGKVTSVAFSPDGTRLVTGGEDGTARVWTTDGDHVLTLTGHERTVTAVAFFPDGRRIATGSRDGTTRTWTSAGEPLRVLTSDSRPITALALAPDGRRLATGSSAGTAHVWTAGGEHVAELAGHENWINAVAFSPDGARVTTASSDRTARTWTTDGTQVAVLTDDVGPVTALAHSPDGKHVATGASDGTGHVWTADGSLVATLLGHQGVITSIAYSPDGAIITTAGSDKTARTWNADGGLVAIPTTRSRTVTSAAFAPNGRFLATASSDGATRVWTREGVLVTTVHGDGNRVNAVAFSPGSHRIATAGHDGTAHVWAGDGSSTATLVGHEHRVNAVAFSPNGELIATAGSDQTARLWDSEGSARAVLTGHRNWVTSVVFSPDGELVATASHDGTARIWSVDGEPVTDFVKHPRPVTSVAFSPDSGTIATGGNDGTARLWTVEGGLLRSLPRHRGRVTAVAFSPNGAHVATAGSEGDAHVLGLDGTVRAVLSGHSESVMTVAFSPRGNHLATGSVDGTTRLWTADGALVATLIATDDGWATLFPDGSYKHGGDVGAFLWWAIKSCRFEVGELDHHYPEIRRLPHSAPMPPPLTS